MISHGLASSKTFLLLVVGLLLLTAWLVQDLGLWSAIGSIFVPWFCTALAISLLVLIVVSALRNEPPRELPWRVVIGTVVVVGVVFLIGIEVDSRTYGLSQRGPARWELVGFLTVLVGVFVVSRRRRKHD